MSRLKLRFQRGLECLNVWRGGGEMRGGRSHFGNVGSRIEKFNTSRSGFLMLKALVLFIEAAS